MCYKPEYRTCSIFPCLLLEGQTISGIPMDSLIARMAAVVRRTYGLTMTDRVIAATALFTGPCVVTRHTADVRNVPQLPREERAGVSSTAWRMEVWVSSPG